MPEESCEYDYNDPNYPGNGVFFDRPSEALIEDLDNLIGGKLFS